MCVVDPAPLAAWPNNYGVWADEFEAMGLEDCLEVVWPQAQVHLDSGERFGSRCALRALHPGRVQGAVKPGDCLEVVWPQAQVHLDSGERFGSRCALRALHPGRVQGFSK